MCVEEEEEGNIQFVTVAVGRERKIEMKKEEVLFSRFPPSRYAFMGVGRRRMERFKLRGAIKEKENGDTDGCDAASIVVAFPPGCCTGWVTSQSWKRYFRWKHGRVSRCFSLQGPETCSVRVAFFVTPLSKVPIFLDVRKEGGGIGRGIFLGAHKFHLQVFPSLHLRGKMHRTDRKQRSFLGVGLSGRSFGGPSIVTDPKAFRMEGIQWAWLPPPYCTNQRKLFLLSSPLKGIELSYLQLQIPRAEGGREKGSNWRLVERAIRETN